jgi:DNA (cytosine-5)-methyltransferase 1
MKVVELFCGIGGFRLACDSLGLETVWANDIDSNAAKVYRHRFGCNEFHQGDINELIETIPQHDLLTAGFPCQPFSSAGKKLGIQDTRGTLFESVVNVLKQRNPKYFVLENVKRLISMDNGKHFATIISSLSELGYFIEWRLLNTINFGLPQNRERIIIVGFRDEKMVSVLSNKNDFSKIKSEYLNGISNPSLWQVINNNKNKFHSWGIAFKGSFFHYPIKDFSESMDMVLLKSVLENNPSDNFYFTEDSLNRIKNSEVVNRFYNGVEILYNQKGGARMGYSIFGINGVAPTLTCTTSRHYERYKIEDKFRRLTNIEYARIQGFPDNHCESVSVYNQYALFGNAVAPPMFKWVIGKIKKNAFFPVLKIENQFKLL